MYQAFTGGLGGIALAKHGKSRAINAENPHGEKGRGGMAASHLGPSRKGSPCLKDIEPGAVVTLAEMEGPGQINHIWITVDNKTTEADCFVLRDLVIRMYWDDEETPSVESPLGDFFCCGFGRECFVNSVPVAVVPNRGFNCYFPMPFKKKAKITLENQHANKASGRYCLFPCAVEKGTVDRKNKRLYNFGWSKRKRPLYRNLYGTYHTGTLLVGRGRNEVLY